MMTQVTRAPVRLLLAAALLATVSSRANATVYDLSRLASDHDDILYQWTFNVGMDGGLKDARSGDVALVDARHNAGEILYAEALPGFDASTDALRSYQVTPGARADGAALRTASSLSLPASGTVEYLFNVVTAENNGVTYVVSSELATVTAQSRRHFGAVHNDGVRLRTAFGETWDEILPGDGLSLSANQWYYVALTFEPNASNRNVVNAYVANLTAGDTTAKHTLVNLDTNATAGPVTAPALGLGCFGSASGNYGHFYNGFVDQVSIYGSRLSHDEINTHVDAIQQKPDLRVDLDVFRNYPGGHSNWMPDVSSWRNDAILGQSATTTTKNPGRGQYGFTFDPSAADGGQMLTLHRNESLRVADIGGGQDMSIEMWLNADALNSALVDTRHTNYSGWLMTVRDSGSVWIRFYEPGNANNWTIESEPELVKADGRYQHLVMSLAADESGGGTATFYVNGQEWGTSTYSNASGYIDPTTAPFRIGHPALGITTGVVPFHGEISGFALYAKALDHGEVLDRFALGVPEPTTAVMMLFGAIFLLAARRRARGAV